MHNRVKETKIEINHYFRRTFSQIVHDDAPWNPKQTNMLHYKGCYAGCSLTQNEHVLFERKGS